MLISWGKPWQRVDGMKGMGGHCWDYSRAGVQCLASSEWRLRSGSQRLPTAPWPFTLLAHISHLDSAWNISKHRMLSILASRPSQSPAFDDFPTFRDRRTATCLRQAHALLYTKPNNRQASLLLFLVLAPRTAAFGACPTHLGPLPTTVTTNRSPG